MYSGYNSVVSGDDVDLLEDECYRYIYYYLYIYDYFKFVFYCVVFFIGFGSKRDNSWMGRGMRVNRLGDCYSDVGYSSDGEYEVDGEYEMLDEDEDESGSNVDGLELVRMLMEKVDEVLMRVEMEDKSI